MRLHAPQGPLTFDTLDFGEAGCEPAPKGDDPHTKQTLEEVVSRHIDTVLKRCGGKIHGPGGAAEHLGIKATTLRARMDKLGIRYKKYAGN